MFKSTIFLIDDKNREEKKKLRHNRKQKDNGDTPMSKRTRRERGKGGRKR